MAKKVTGFIKLQIQAGRANPAPPVGPALGQHGVNIMDFCKAFNADTQDKMRDLIPVETTAYADRSFTFITKTPPAARLILKAAKVPKGSGEPNREKVGSVTEDPTFTTYQGGDGSQWKSVFGVANEDFPKPTEAPMAADDAAGKAQELSLIHI